MKVLNLPTKLTISRILAVPFIILFLYVNTPWSCAVATILFTLAGFTDVIDGYIARRENQVTRLGKFLDPLADKILVCSVLVMLVHLRWAPAWIAIVIICRDIMVTGLRAIAADEGVVIAADRYGKMKTVVQMVALGPLILHYSWMGLPVERIGNFLLYIALALTVFSGYNYFMRFFREWRTLQGADNKPEDAGRVP